MPLDVFVYPEREIGNNPDLYGFIQIFGGVIVYDKTGAASGLMQKVHEYVEHFPKKTQSEKEELKVWCGKMLHRASRSDAEGAYRAHWLLVDSLQIYCDIRNLFYFGPKKTIQFMENSDPSGFNLFSDALKNQAALEAWIHYICKEDTL